MINQNDISKRHADIQNDIGNKSLEIIGFFKNPSQKNLVSAIKKLEKIVAGIYLVTDVMDSGLPLTQQLRQESLVILSAGYRTIEKTNFLCAEQVSMWGVQVDYLLGLVRIGTIAHHISTMNGEILSKELEKITTVIFSEAQALASIEKNKMIPGISIDQPLVPHTVMRDDLFEDILKHAESKRHQNDIKTTLSHQLFQNDISKRHDETKRHFKTTLEKNHQNNNENRNLVKNEVLEKIDRKQKIITLIKNQGVITTGDIKKALPEMSDKMIQREIAHLIEIKMIRKNGNKRWATYQLI